MRCRLVFGSFVLGALLLASGAHAITQLFSTSFTCFSGNAQCDFAPMGSGPGASSSIDRQYGSFLTHADLTIPDWDSFGTDVRASADYVEEFAVPFANATARTLARFRDTLTVSGGSGTGSVRLSWHVEGSTTIEWQASQDITNVTARVMVDFLCFSGPGSTRPCSSPHREWTANAAIDEVITVDIPIVFGQPSETFLEIDLRADFGFSRPLCPGPCLTSLIGAADGSFGATGTLIDVQLFDSAGTELDPSLIQAESSFRYDLVGVPEPSLVGLVGVGLSALGWSRRRG
jgi:hypothetical protein